MAGEVSDPVRCGDVTIEGKSMRAVCVRLTDAVRVELRDVRHVSDLFAAYHFVVKLHTGSEPRVHATDNALLLEVDGATVQDLEFSDVVKLIEAARDNDFIVFKLVLFPVFVLHVSSTSSLPPAQLQFHIKCVPYDNHSFFYAVSQGLAFGREDASKQEWQRLVASSWRHTLWRAWQQHWGALNQQQKKEALRVFRASYPHIPANADPSTGAFWLQGRVTEFHIRFWSDVARVKLVIYAFKSKQRWNEVCRLPLVTMEDLAENGKPWRTVLGSQYTNIVYLLNVYDGDALFEHFAALIPVPYSCAFA